MVLLDCTPESIMDRGIDQLAIAEPVATAGLRQQVRATGHVFHATRHNDACRTAGEQGMRQHDGLKPAASHFINRQATNLIGQSCTQPCLTGRCLPQASADDIAHDTFINTGRIDPGARDRCTDCTGAKIRRRQIAKRALELADWRTGSAHEHNVTILHEYRSSWPATQKTPTRKRTKSSPATSLCISR